MEAAKKRGRGDGNARASFWLSWSLAGLSVAMFVATFPLYVLARSAQVPSSWGANLSLGNLLGGGLFLIFPLVGALIASRHPRNPIGWILLGYAALISFTAVPIAVGFAILRYRLYEIDLI